MKKGAYCPQHTSVLGWISQMNKGVTGPKSHFNSGMMTPLSESDLIAIQLNKKLNNNHIKAVLDILKEQFCMADGFQDTCKIPSIEKNGDWMVYVPGHTGQIHHNDMNHWIVSFRNMKDEVFIADSQFRSKTVTLNPSIQWQLLKIYAKPGEKLVVNLPAVQQQENNIDCGMFAIAFLVEACFCHGFEFNMSTRFDTTRMRSHLVSCLKKNTMEPFPKDSTAQIHQRNKTMTAEIGPITLPTYWQWFKWYSVAGKELFQQMIS